MQTRSCSVVKPTAAADLCTHGAVRCYRPHARGWQQPCLASHASEHSCTPFYPAALQAVAAPPQGPHALGLEHAVRAASQAAEARLLDLLARLTATGEVSQTQAARGAARFAASVEDLALDCPGARASAARL